MAVSGMIWRISKGTLWYAMWSSETGHCYKGTLTVWVGEEFWLRDERSLGYIGKLMVHFKHIAYTTCYIQCVCVPGTALLLLDWVDTSYHFHPLTPLIWKNFKWTFLLNLYNCFQKGRVWRWEKEIACKNVTLWGDMSGFVLFCSEHKLMQL